MMNDPPYSLTMNISYVGQNEHADAQLSIAIHIKVLSTVIIIINIAPTYKEMMKNHMLLKMSQYPV